MTSERKANLLALAGITAGAAGLVVAGVSWRSLTAGGLILLGMVLLTMAVGTAVKDRTK